MKRNIGFNVRKVVLILLLMLLSIAIIITHNLLSKRSYAAVDNLSYTGVMYSSDYGLNLQCAENHYNFSVGTSISANNMQKVNGVCTSTSDKVTVTIAMERQGSGLNSSYAIMASMFYRVEQYNYKSAEWEARDWNYWFNTTVYKYSGSHLYNPNANGELNYMVNYGSYPKSTVYDLSGEDKIDLHRKANGEEIYCVDLFSINGREAAIKPLIAQLESKPTIDNTSYSFDISGDGRYRIAITAISWRWELSSKNRCWAAPYINGVKKDNSDNRITSTEFVIDHNAPTGTLNGVDDGGYTNSDVSFSWITNNYEDTTATLNGASYTSGKKITAEGSYTLVLKDFAKSTTYTFVIDKTAPKGTLSGVIDGGYTNRNVTFSWTDSNASAELNGAEYISDTKITENGHYTLILSDKANNSTTYSFVIDKTAPSFSVSVSDKGYTNNDVTVSVTDNIELDSLMYGISDTLSEPAMTNMFVSGRKYSGDGYYSFKATDKAGNASTYSFVIDKTAPTIQTYSEYTNQTFVLVAQDKYSNNINWEYSLNDGTVTSWSGKTITLGGGASSNGVWKFRAIDDVGNASSWGTVNHVYRETFGNIDSIYNSFNVPSYYEVTLSQKNYNSCYGTYTFAEYEYALRFAIQKEWECRVIELEGGASWNYVTPTNENSRQIYTDRLELDNVIERYANKNISGRKVISKNGVIFSNPTDENGVTHSGALTVQISELPELLVSYSEYRYMLAPIDCSLSIPESVVPGNKSVAAIRFISDGVSLRNGAEQLLAYGIELKNVIDEQGWYLITESDVCGNIEKYLVFIDLQEPELLVDVAYGNGSKELINFNQSYVEENTETMRFISFDVNSFRDNIDNCVMLSMEGRNLSDKYIAGDELPVLSYENGYYGAYAITVYDRSHNYISFVVYIAGEDPTLKYSSLTNETACTFTVQINDSYNAITDIKFFKVHFDGTEEAISVDSYGTVVCAENLSYRMDVGGKYIFEFTDLYGRNVRTNAIFYMKGLPTATLRGVKDGGLTKNDVSVIYDVSATAELYIFNSGEWASAELFETVQGVTTTSINITAGRDTTGIYKVLLYVTNDRNLFTEYTFEIDGILPIVEILTESGEPITAETVSTQYFLVTWQESGYKAYYKKQGTLSDNSYTRDTLIVVEGTYLFTIYDAARNELSFTITLDNSVSYTLEGTYMLLEDGSYISRNNFTFTLTEPWAEFNVEASNGIRVLNGQKLDADGTYRISVKDMYGNQLALTLIVDKLPPVAYIVTESGVQLSNTARTSEAFQVLCEEEDVTITYSFGTSGFVAYEGAFQDDIGEYTFRLSDRVGNTLTVTVTIDREVTYRVDGTYQIIDGVIYSKNWILVVPTEATSIFDIEDADGTSYDTSKRVSEEGIYNAVIADIAGNKLQLNFVIDKTAPVAYAVTESGKTSSGGAVNEAFRVVCEENGVEITYAIGKGKYMPYTGEMLDEGATYNFIIKDFLGNAASLSILINYYIAFDVSGTYVVRDDVYYSRSWLLITPTSNVTDFIIEDEDENLLDTSKRISTEGVYTVTMIDDAGNKLVLNVVIDKTAPVAHAVTESGKGLNNNDITNEKLILGVEEDDFNITYTLNGINVGTYDFDFLTERGTYVFTLTDFLGNSATFKLTIDRSVDLTVNGTYVNNEQGDYISRNWLSVTLDEEMKTFFIISEDGIEYGADSRITAEGSYTVSAQDIFGNELTIHLVIDKTAPEIELIGVSDSGSTNSIVSISIVDFLQAYYRLNGGDKLIATNGQKFENEGSYIITAVDLVGNTANVSFVIDKHVDAAPNISLCDSQIITGAVSFKFGEDLSALLYRDGEVATYYRNGITQPGEYTLVLTDGCGNEKAYNWTIVAAVAKQYALKAPEGAFVSIELNGAPIETIFESDKLLLSQTGNYLIWFETSSGNWMLELEVDNIAPEVQIKNTGKSILISDPNKDGLSYALYRDGVQVSFSMKNSAELTENGNYHLICTDSVGNVTEYSFELNYLNTVSIALVVVACVLVLIGIIAILVVRFKRKVY